MAKSDKKATPKETQRQTEGPRKFHLLSDDEKKDVLDRMGKGRAALQGPDHIVVDL